MSTHPPFKEIKLQVHNTKIIASPFKIINKRNMNKDLILGLQQQGNYTN